MKLRRSHVIAIVIAAAAVAWMTSGTINLGGDASDHAENGAPAAQGAAPAERERPLMEVRVRELDAVSVDREVIVNAHTEPARSVRVRAETTGRIASIGAERGARVDTGQLIVQLDDRDRSARIAEAEALLAQRELEYTAAEKLGAKGYQAETRVAEMRAYLAAAKAALEREKVERTYTVIKAPFAGILDERPVEIGDFVDIGDLVATVIEQDPFLVVGNVTEREIAGLRPGMSGTAWLITGETVEGHLRYIASAADSGTRTFRVELEVDNPSGRFAAGVSAELRLILDAVTAHRISAALLALDDTGAVGIKAVDEDDVVRFHPARIVRAQADAVWLAGLPDHLRLITVGQGFVRAGDTVKPMPEQGVDAVEPTS